MTICFARRCDLLRMWREMFKGFEKEAELMFFYFTLLFSSFFTFRVGVFFLVMNTVFGNLSAVELFIKERPTFMSVVEYSSIFYYIMISSIMDAL